MVVLTLVSFVQDGFGLTDNGPYQRYFRYSVPVANGPPIQVQQRSEIVPNRPLQGQKLADQYTVPSYRLRLAQRSPVKYTVPSYDC